MSYTVQTKVFTGPFDLLLSLVSRDKVSIEDINLANIADQYLAEMALIEEVDLEVASDFVFVAAALLVIKSGYYLPVDAEIQDDFLDEVPLSQEEALAFLTKRLLRYRAYRQAASYLEKASREAQKKFQRVAPLPHDFSTVQPDYLEGTTLAGFATVAAHVFARHDAEILSAEHIRKKRVSLKHTATLLMHAIKTKKRLSFSELFDQIVEPEEVVVNFLAVLDLLRKGEIEAYQKSPFVDIELSLKE